MPIMMDETTSEIETNAISTYVTAFTIFSTEPIRIPVMSVYSSFCSSGAFSLYASRKSMNLFLDSKSLK